MQLAVAIAGSRDGSTMTCRVQLVYGSVATGRLLLHSAFFPTSLVADGCHCCCCALQIPLLMWMSAVVIIFGVSFQKLNDLQGPLASLNVAAHVVYGVARVRHLMNMLAFAEQASDKIKYRPYLKEEISLLKHEYEVLLYGGEVVKMVSDSRDITSDDMATFT